MPPDEAPAPVGSDELEVAFTEFLDLLLQAETAVRASPSYGSDLERAAGYEHLARSIRKAVDSAILQDADHPEFRILDHWQREGGDNPDQLYAFAPIHGGRHYRIRGTVGSACRVEVQLYSGDPWAGAGAGASVGYLPFEDLDVDDGSFTVELAADPEPGTGLVNPPEATSVFVRHIYDRWTDELSGEVHIDLVGEEGARVLPASTAEIAERYRRAGRILDQAVTVWPAFVHARYVARFPNSVSEPVDTYALGGVRGRWMAGGHFDLAPDQALVLVTRPTDAAYQAIQLTDMWFASLEYANLVSSLTTTQSVLGPDGAYHTIICAEDPGYPNWLDTGGHHRGVFLLRYDGVPGALPEEAHPTARLVDLVDLASAVPGWADTETPDRVETRAARRRHLQRRTHR